MNKNDKIVADYLVDEKAFLGSFGIQRSKIVRALAMRRSTVYDALKRLEIRGIVRRDPAPSTGQVGRRIVLWTLTGEEF